MHPLENSGKFYYVKLNASGQILATNTCFYTDFPDQHSDKENAAETPLYFADFLREPVASEFRMKFNRLLHQPSDARFESDLMLYRTPASTFYMRSEWEFCKQGADIIGVGSKTHTEAPRSPLVPASSGSQDLLEVFFSKSENIFFIKDTDGTYLSASPAFYRYFEVTEEELIGRRDADILGNLLGGQCVDSDTATLQKGMTTFQMEYDEHGRQFEVTKFPFTLKDGTAVIGGIMRETTEQFRTNARLRYIAEQVPGVLFEFHQIATEVQDDETPFRASGTRNHYNYISPKIYDYTGYTSEEIIDDYVIPYTLIHEEDRPRVKQALAKATAQTHTSEVEYRSYHRSKAGMRWMRSVSKPARQADGSVIWYGIVTDITSMKQKEAALRGAERKFHLVAENISDGILVFDEQRRIIYVSTSLTNQFDLHPEELLGKNLDQILYFIHPDDRQPVYEYIIKNLKHKKEHFSYEYRVTGPDDQLWWREDSTSVIYDERGRLYRAYVIARDITHRKKMEQELRSSLDLLTNQNHRLTSFTHIVSHNLRSHASNIIGLLSLIDDVDSDQEKIEILDLLQKPAHSLDEALHHLNEIISIQSNLSKKQSLVNLRERVDNSLHIIKGSLESIRAKVDVDVSKSLCVRCIPAYMDSILLNFLTNAVKYRVPSRQLQIKISGQETAEGHIISVEDNGLGIDLKRYKDRLFGMYKTFHNNPDARGIGLFVTKNQVEAMGGRIDVQSQLGQKSGTTFSVYLRKKTEVPG